VSNALNKNTCTYDPIERVGVPMGAFFFVFPLCGLKDIFFLLDSKAGCRDVLLCVFVFVKMFSTVRGW
jgi:hypothetical protein